MKCLKTLGVAVTFILLVCAYTFAGDAKMKTMSQQICPVMTFGEIGCSVTKHDIYTDYNDKRIYFCSKGCLEKFQKDPAKYVQKLENEGVTLEKVSNTGLKKESSPGNNASGKQNSACGNCDCDS